MNTVTASPMDRFYDESTTEFKGHEHIRDHIFHDPTITIQTMAACAAYAAVLRYVTRGRDEYPIAPRNVAELRAVLINHTTDVIHSLISQTRARIQPGSYQLARRLSQESIEGMLCVGDNAEHLLAVHSSTTTDSNEAHGHGHEEERERERDEPFMEHVHEYEGREGGHRQRVL